MLARSDRARGFPPFDSDRVVWYYLGRNAVYFAIQQLGLSGHEILMPAYHHGVEVEAVVAAGAKPRFYRVDRHWNIDLQDLQSRIGRRTGAVYLTHFAGKPGPIRELRGIADAYGISLIEDCALSLLSSHGETPLGTTGDASIFCLYKTLPVPHGGALRFRHTPEMEGRDRDLQPQPAPLASTLSHSASSLLTNFELRWGSWGRAMRRSLLGLGRLAFDSARVRRVGKGTASFDPDHVELGMSRLARQLAEAQDLGWIVERRRENYQQLLEGLGSLAPPSPLGELPDGVSPLFYPLLVEDKAAVLQGLWRRGIEAIDFWSTSHPDCDLREFPEVAWLRRHVIEIPCHQDLSARHLTWTIDAVRQSVDA